MMNYKIIISAATLQDTFEAFNYYEKKENGLGIRFLAVLEQYYQKLKNNPSYYSYLLIEYNIRAVALKKFPYIIIYEIDGDQVNVFAVHNTYRNPDLFIKRITK